jgi:hypothetical protein
LLGKGLGIVRKIMSVYNNQRVHIRSQDPKVTKLRRWPSLDRKRGFPCAPRKFAENPQFTPLAILATEAILRHILGSHFSNAGEDSAYSGKVTHPGLATVGETLWIRCSALNLGDLPKPPGVLRHRI